MDSPSAGVRVTVRVRPGASRTRVAGHYGDPADRILAVAVTARAVDGAANRAVLEAVAQALGVPARAVTLAAGARGRTKIVHLAADPEVVRPRLDELLES